MEGNPGCNLPPGFRFHPTDEELIMHYLKNQATSRPCPVSIIPEVDIYKFDPWQLPGKAEFGEKEWYFFSPRDRKYPNGARPNRATVSGYWKATGTDKAIYSGTKYVGVKKALVFYGGRPPKGVKSDWIMHEYRLTDAKLRTSKQPAGSMRLDDWVLCRIYKKKSPGRINHTEQGSEHESPRTPVTTGKFHEPTTMKFDFPRTSSLTYLMDLDYWAPLSHLLSDGPSSLYNTTEINGGGRATGGHDEAQKLNPSGDWMKLEVDNQKNTTGSTGSVFFNQFPALTNSVYEFH